MERKNYYIFKFENNINILKLREQNWTYSIFEGRHGEIGWVRVRVKKWIFLNGNEIVWVNRVTVELGRPVFFHIKYFNKKINLSFGKSCNKLLYVKFVILNSPLISKMGSTQQINICLIIIKLYKSQHC